jgi:hypothetical protein
VRTASLLLLAAVASLAAPAGATGGADYAIRLVAPVDASGRLTRAPVVAGVPFRVRVELTATGFRGVASVAYDLELPTGIHSAGVRLARSRLPLDGSLRTSTCSRACAIGWDTTRKRRLAVYYALVVPGPGRFLLGASISSTNHHDIQPADDRGSTIVSAVAPRLSLGTPRLVSGAPRAARTFSVTIPVRLNGVSVVPESVRCTATAKGVTLQGASSRRPGEAGCEWRLPVGSRGSTLHTTVTVVARSLRIRGSWLFAVRG